MKKSVILAVLMAAGLSGCASVIDGTSQPMSIATNPEGAECRLMRNGELLSRITTPQTINIKKTKHDINIECELEGFHNSTEHVTSEIQDATWGNIILGGGIGWAVDSASGADNKYKEHVTITMVPLNQPALTVVAEPEGTVSESDAPSEGAESQGNAVVEAKAGEAVPEEEVDKSGDEPVSGELGSETETNDTDSAMVEGQEVSTADQELIPDDDFPVDESIETMDTEGSGAAGSQ